MSAADKLCLCLLAMQLSFKSSLSTLGLFPPLPRLLPLPLLLGLILSPDCSVLLLFLFGVLASVGVNSFCLTELLQLLLLLFDLLFDMVLVEVSLVGLMVLVVLMGLLSLSLLFLLLNKLVAGGKRGRRGGVRERVLRVAVIVSSVHNV